MGGDCLNLDLAPQWQRTCLIREARREIRRVRERLSVDPVDGLVIADLRECDVHRDELVQVEAAALAMLRTFANASLNSSSIVPAL